MNLKEEEIMDNLLLTRIDNRLIHGQVGVTWTNYLGANLVVVANDIVANDEVQQSLMDMVLPDTVQSRFFTIDRTIQILEKASPKQKIFLVVKDLEDLLKLIEGGIPINKVNIGNLHYSEDKEQLSSTISLGSEDLNILKKLKSRNVVLEVQGVPGERKSDLYELAKI